ncbi:unnamed protein product [Adineta steineri]|uniref:Uncharacterized protein n=1 Tax=Adineta steineri TaxID=433720 RepID=A0A813T3I4_9BILA|nr:unnamed protein product [Adineta steineri]
MLLFSLSLSLQILINHQKLIIISSFSFITNKNIQLIIQIDRFDLILMIYSLSNSITCLNKQNFNQNSHNINRKTKLLHRLIQSSTDITTNNHYSCVNRDNSQRTSDAIRIESALMTSDYSHSIVHVSQSITNININKTIDLIKRNGAGDEILCLHSDNKQIQISPITDNNQYLTLEQVPIYNRRTVQFTSKQLIFISFSVFLFVILLCLTTSFFL